MGELDTFFVYTKSNFLVVLTKNIDTIEVSNVSNIYLIEDIGVPKRTVY